METGIQENNSLPILTSEVVRHRVFDLKSEETENYEKILEECIIDPNNPIPDPEVILSYNSVPVLWRGGKSFICAVAKARKTTALTLFSAILLGKDETVNGFKALPACRVLFVDTEQAKYDSQKILNRVSRLCGKDPKEMTELMVLSLNRHGYEDIKILIETAIRNFKPDVLMLDNWTDCVSSVLDEKDCTKFSKDLRALAELYELAVFSVIHANEGDGKTDKPKFRGWAIEEARKSDLTLYLKDMSDDPSIELRGEYSRARFGKCRGMRPDDFNIAIDIHGLPYIYHHTAELVSKPDRNTQMLELIPKEGIGSNDLAKKITDLLGYADVRTGKQRLADLFKSGLIVKQVFGNKTKYFRNGDEPEPLPLYQSQQDED
ncbi:MAG: hypothetical protein J1F67_03750 [Muribaculaceae bacterium]|nr:hypothetical protein [Muribaculaceae bacterium]